MPFEFFTYYVNLEAVLSNIVTGAIGGLIVAVFTFGLSYVRRKQIEYKFPLKGEYVSFFEDLVDGQKIIVASKSYIRQRGIFIRIVTDADGRTWTLTGNILAGSHISGVYSADAPYDEGVGSFYFKITEDGLDGMWNGHDHVNKTISGGRYWMRRMKQVSVRPYRSEDLNDILHTSANAFGYGYFDVRSLVNNEDHFALVAEFDGNFAGFCTGYILASGNASKETYSDRRDMPDDVRFADERGSLGVLKTIAVVQRLRGCGIGSNLFREGERYLVEKGAECVLVPAWRSNGIVNMHNLLRRMDYTFWKSVKGYWRSECEAREFQCKLFQDSCICSADFYHKGRV